MNVRRLLKTRSRWTTAAYPSMLKLTKRLPGSVTMGQPREQVVANSPAARSTAPARRGRVAGHADQDEGGGVHEAVPWAEERAGVACRV